MSLKTTDACYAYAIGLLAARDYSRARLCQKLEAFGCKNGVCHACVRRLEKEGLLNDASFCENYVNYAKDKLWGPLKIKAKLTHYYKVSEDIAEKAVEENAPLWQDVALKLCEKKFSTPPGDEKERRKRQQFLYQKGFTSSTLFLYDED